MSKIIKSVKNNMGYYLPMFNNQEIVSSITPFFSGDLNLGYYNYALEPISDNGLYNLTGKRNVHFFIDNVRYDLNGQLSHQQEDEIVYEVDMLKQIVRRTNNLFELVTESIVPVNDSLEVHKITLKNTTSKEFRIKVTTSVPLYSRSPENLHDHRHVTSLLNVAKIVENGIINKPTLTFDERGHKENEYSYSVFAYSKQAKAINYIPTLDEYINLGSLTYPKGINGVRKHNVGDVITGYEVIGAIEFEEVALKPNETYELILTIGINNNEEELLSQTSKYKDFNNFDLEVNKVLEHYKNLNRYIKFNLESSKKTNQLEWVTLQPILRRNLGNSFLPHHDYGHGGRGWRDLWQDLLSLIYSGDKSVKEAILNNFKGVRIDGSNATIIGTKPGEFRADRNLITRVWSDHGAWPLLTTKLYIDETGDIDILFNKQSYYEDQFTHYTKANKDDYHESNNLHIEGHLYEGTIFEHLLLQNIVGYFNIGKNGFTRLEDADWNDGLDMASDLGETIPFTMFYLNNLRVLSDLLNNINQDSIEVNDTLLNLVNEEITLKEFFDRVAINDIKVTSVNKDNLNNKLLDLINRKDKHINDNSVINNTHYQGYYDNKGIVLDNSNTASLTAQAMALINNIPSTDFATKVANKTKELLFDENIGGYRLNSNYNKVLPDMGRAYGFSYGHKENGAVFCHMATMYSYGLYNYDLVDYGREAIHTLLDQSLKDESKVLAGVPEYYNNKGVGMYPFLTGTASWIVKLLREQVYGLNMSYGELSLNPKLTLKDFNEGVASIETIIFGNKVLFKYYNFNNIEYGKYVINKILINDKETNERKFSNLNGIVEVYLDEIN